MSAIKIGHHRIDVSNPDKILFPEDGITKGQLIDYYQRVAKIMLPHVQGRPIMMQRFPNGIQKPGFYQKGISEHFPDWIHRVTLAKVGGTVTHVVCDDAATLVYLADQACITVHVWPSRADRPDNPDEVIFDLDPSGSDFAPVRAGARMLHELLEELGLRSFVKTTGGRGLHLVVPLDRSADFDTVRAFAREIADLAAERDPGRLTTEARKAKRRGRVLIDVMRNSYAQTAVAPYTVRARPKAPVATPIEWGELGGRNAEAPRYTMKSIFRLLDRRNDPWAGMYRHAHSLKEPRRRLDALIRKEQAAGRA